MITVIAAILLVGGITGLFVRSQQARHLTVDQSLARFAMIAIAEVLAFLVFSVPLAYYGLGSAPTPMWVQDCFKWGGITVLFVLLALIFHFAAAFLSNDRDWVAPWTERVIVLIYYADILGLSAAIVRTGGPAKSLYASLIPIQLAGFLLLEVQKELLISQDESGKSHNRFAYVFASLTITGWITSHVARSLLLPLLSKVDDTSQLDFSAWITGLSVLGILLTVIAYVLPRQPWFNNMLSQGVRRQLNGAK